MSDSPSKGVPMTETSPEATLTDAAVAATGVVKIYGQGAAAAVAALRGVDVTFPRGTFTAVMGPSGSGKSTLMHCLAGLDRVTAGAVSIGGVELSILTDDELTRLRRDKVGFIFQQFNLLPTLTALENIVLPLELAGRTVDRADVDAVVGPPGRGRRLGVRRVICRTHPSPTRRHQRSP